MCWRSLNNIIPTSSNLLSKGILSNRLCCFCRSFHETTCHIMWECKFTKMVWLLYLPSYVGLVGVGRGRWSPLDYWENLKRVSSRQELDCRMIIMWSLWNMRNRVRFRKTSPSLDRIGWGLIHSPPLMALLLMVLSLIL